MLFIFGIFLLSCNSSVNSSNSKIDYSLENNWVYPVLDNRFSTDVFFVAPTVFLGNDTTFNMSITDTNIRKQFKGSVNMEKGIYDENSDFYSPYYRQVSLSAFKLRGYDEEATTPDLKSAFDTAYEDVEKSFEYYLSISDDPFILAGFSQGAEIIIKLIKENFDNESLRKRLIAAYAIGWRLNPEDTLKFPHLKSAKSENDLGVVISYSTEAEYISKSIIVPEKTLSVNPLSWETNNDVADKSFNSGACFPDYNGIITKEIPHLTGAYICPVRGTLKVTDISANDYPPILDIFTEGEYHIYDYMFFYRNLQENVKKRIDNYMLNNQ